MELLAITLSNPLAKVLFPAPMTLSFVLIPPEDTTMIPFSWKLKLLSSHFGNSCLWINGQATLLARLILMLNSDHQGKIGLLLQNRGKEEYFWRSPRFSLVSPSPVITQNRKVNPGRYTNGSDSSAMKVWVTPPGKETQPAGVLASGGNTEWVLERGSHKYQLWLHNHLYKWGLKLSQVFPLYLAINMRVCRSNYLSFLLFLFFHHVG